MVNVEKISQVAMEIITYAGLAKSCYMEALMLCKHGEYQASKEKLCQGDESFSQAHSSHLQTLSDEMSTQDPQITLLLTHAEDQLMGAETIKILVQENIDIYKEMRGISI